MGFTFSHPALIIPCKYFPKRFYSLSGLIVGSMIPDLEYFIRGDTRSDYSHTFAGIFWFDMPCALLCMFIFHLVIRDVLINSTPEYLLSKLVRFRYFDWLSYFKKNWIVVICSTFIGIASHLFWDSFTSYAGFFVQRSSFLISRVDLFFLTTRNYKILKYVSSIIGLLAIVYEFKLLKSDPVPSRMPKNNYWLLIAIISIPLSIIRIYRTDPDDLSLNSILKITISSLLLGLFTASVYLKKSIKTKT